jgi:hypothetical protein
MLIGAPKQMELEDSCLNSLYHCKSVTDPSHFS